MNKHDEIKEKPFDDMVDLKQEHLIYYASDDNIINEGIKEIKEEVFEDFTDVKQEEPIIDGFNARKNDLMDIKEGPIDNFVDIKEEELSTFPIADVFCPSTGNSRLVTIDFDEGMHSRRQITSRPMMRANHVQMMQSERYSMLLKECAFCDQSHAMGTEMENHVRSIHPEEFARFRLLANMDNQSRSMRPGHFEESRQRDTLVECIYCNASFPAGHAMNTHVGKIHTRSVSRDLVMCPFGDGFFKMGDEIEKHMITMHPKVLARKCDHCDAVHDKGTEMDNHLQSMHLDILERLNSAVASIRDGRHNKDEELAIYNNLPISAAEIVDMPLSELKKLVKFDSLPESERELIMKIRRRGQNRVSNRKCYAAAAAHIGPKRPHKKRLSKDEKLAIDNNLPFSAAEIGEMSLSDFQQLLKTDSLTESQCELIKQIRKREKRKFVRQRAESQRELIARIEKRGEEELKNSSSVGYSNHH